MTLNELKKLSGFTLANRFPYLEDYFLGRELTPPTGPLTLGLWLKKISTEVDELGLSIAEIESELLEFIEASETLLNEQEFTLETLAILAGRDKNGKSEPFQRYLFNAGDIISVVGATGSGKSRFLGDIESLAERDTPSQRLIELNGAAAPHYYRFSAEKKLVAQLSQNMNFVMDIGVEDFLLLHAESRLINDKKEVVKRVIAQANELTGEKFTGKTQLTQLSGGQSRALMIADTALISSSPIVLIDEIENAGVDRKKALSLFTEKGKIVFIATHDPLLALMASQRLVIQNGAITAHIQTSSREQELLTDMLDVDKRMMQVRNQLRCGEQIETF